MSNAASNRTYSTGKRKTAVARVWISPGSGQFTVNGKPSEQYFERETSVMVAKQALELIEAIEQFDVVATVCGGGHSAQAEATRHGISRALCLLDPEKRGLKRAGFLSDARRRTRGTVSRAPASASSAERPRAAAAAPPGAKSGGLSGATASLSVRAPRCPWPQRGVRADRRRAGSRALLSTLALAAGSAPRAPGVHRRARRRRRRQAHPALGPAPPRASVPLPSSRRRRNERCGRRGRYQGCRSHDRRPSKSPPPKARLTVTPEEVDNGIRNVAAASGLIRARSSPRRVQAHRAGLPRQMRRRAQGQVVQLRVRSRARER